MVWFLYITLFFQKLKFIFKINLSAIIFFHFYPNILYKFRFKQQKILTDKLKLNFNFNKLSKYYKCKFTLKSHDLTNLYIFKKNIKLFFQKQKKF